MARTGVTENQIHAAADALVLRGERPTIERIRAHLGTGSPNTLLRGIETWWTSLGARLSAERASLAIPDAPVRVTAAASSLWREALAEAQRLAEAGIAEDRTTLANERQGLIDAGHILETERSLLRREVDATMAAKQRLDAQMLELRAQLQQIQTALQDARTERDRWAGEAQAAGAMLVTLQQRVQATATQTAKERTHLMASEARWMAEVDRLRQELKAVDKERALERRKVDEQARATAAELKEALRARVEAERSAVAAKAVVAALEVKLDGVIAKAGSAAHGTPAAPRRMASAKSASRMTRRPGVKGAGKRQ